MVLFLGYAVGESTSCVQNAALRHSIYVPCYKEHVPKTIVRAWKCEVHLQEVLKGIVV